VWKDIAATTSYIAAPESSTPTTFLSATNHNDLINFVKDTYSEGKFNCTDSSLQTSITEFQSKKNNGALTLDGTYTTVSACPDSFVNNTVTSDTIMASGHYNNLTGPLYIGGNNLSPVSKDAKGDAVSNQNATEAGPVAGVPITDTTPAKPYI
jgi:hypothetical protein